MGVSSLVKTAGLAISVAACSLPPGSDTSPSASPNPALNPIGRRSFLPMDEDAKYKINRAEALMSRILTPEAKSCLKGSPFELRNLSPSPALYGEIPAGEYHKSTGIRSLHASFVHSEPYPLVFSVYLHEIIHRVVDCEVVRETPFLSRFSRMDPLQYRIISQVDAQLEKYDKEKAHIPGEKVAITVEFHVVKGEPLPPEIQMQLSRMFVPQTPALVSQYLVPSLEAMMGTINQRISQTTHSP